MRELQGDGKAYALQTMGTWQGIDSESESWVLAGNEAQGTPRTLEIWLRSLNFIVKITAG